jgi:zinc transport system substrate-binding protein
MIKKYLLLLIIPAALITGCKPRQAEDGKPVITVTILPLKYFAGQLAGEHFRINVLVPPGVSHHNYDPTPKQLRELEESKALFMVGQLGFEKGWIPKMRSNYRNLPIFDLSEGISLILDEEGEGGHDHGDEHQEESDGHSHEGVDPHFWMSVTEARKIAVTMAGGLIQADPSCKQLIESNLRTLTARLDSLETVLAGKLNNLTHRSFLIFHPALAYIARDYNLTQHSMELGGKEPTASHFRKLVDLAVAEKINTVFIQKEYDQENARSLARETGSRIVTIDPMSPDWFREMVELGDKLAEMDQR